MGKLLTSAVPLGPIDCSDFYSRSAKWDVSVCWLNLLSPLRRKIFNWKSRRLYPLKDLGIDPGGKDENNRYVVILVCRPTNAAPELSIAKKLLGRSS